MAMADASHFDRLVEFLEAEARERHLPRHHRARRSLRAVAAGLLPGDGRQGLPRAARDRRLHRSRCASEIGALQVNDLKNSRIPSAGEELGAIVQATENATNTIMECAEALMAADASDPAAYKALVDEKMMIIFEACSFQDITGQRIAKVVETLQHIEQRVARFADVMQAKDIEGFLSEHERARAERKEKLLLNGPQLAGEGVDQSDVDKMFA